MFLPFFARFSVSVQRAPAHRCTYWHCTMSRIPADRQPVALGGHGGSSAGGVGKVGDDNVGNDGGAALTDEDALQARLDALRRG